MSGKVDFRPRNLKVYTLDDLESLLRGVKVAACMLTEPQQMVVDEESVLKRVNALTITARNGGGGGEQCSCCRVLFESRAQQIAHYKHHWHAYNIKRRLFGKPPLTLANFTSRQDDNSSVSGSDSDEDTGNSGNNTASDLFVAATRHCKAFFTNCSGEVFCLYRCILHHRKEMLSTDGEGTEWVSRVQGLVRPGAQRWAVLMVSGGHFAGAVFSGGVAVVHKTFHSYVTRRGQGQSQGTRDQQGNAPKSAGASLRRYNQAQFALHVQEILASWSEDLSGCSLILYRAVGPINQGVLFGKGSPLLKEDLRLRAFPFPTRKPTFKEVQRAHATVANIEVYDTMELFQRALIASSAPTADTERSRKHKPSPTKPDRAKSREPVTRELPTQMVSSEDEGPCYIDSETPVGWIKTLSEQSSKGQITNSRKDLLNDNEREKGSESSGSETETQENQDQQLQLKKKKKKKKLKIDDSKKIPQVKIPDKIKNLWKVISTGDQDKLETIMETWCESDGAEEVARAVNVADPKDGNTALHKAALACSPDLVTRILNAGGDPCARNHARQTPYVAGENKDTRLAFRYFQGEFPDKYNYAKAHIPGPLTPQLLAEVEERKTAQRRAKRQRDKEKQQEKIRTNKFLDLTDAEKVKDTAPRCFLCGSKLPKASFEYDQFKFCSVKCLQNHRNVRPLHLPA